MSREGELRSGRPRRKVLHTLGAGLGVSAIAASTALTVAGGDKEREQGESREEDDRSGPLIVHGPTTVYPANKHHRPGVFGELENVSGHTIWVARLSVTFYDEDGRVVGTRKQYFLYFRPGERRTIEIPFVTDRFDDRSWTLDTSLLQVVF